MQLSEIRKTVVTALGFIVSIGSFILPYVTDVSPEVGNTVGALVGVATIVLNYLAPNETDDPERAVGRSVRVKGTEPISTGRHAKRDPGLDTGL